MFKVKLDFFKSLEGLPSPPFQVLEVLEEVGNTPFTDFDIVAMIRNDPAIACRILKAANEPLYGFPSQIFSLQQASGLLGPGPIKNIILTTPILERFGKSFQVEPNLDCILLWRHMAVSAGIAEELGKWVPEIESAVCYTAGLIHDIGKIALMVHHPRILAESAKHARAKKIPLDAACREVIGWTIASVSGTLAENWNFPPTLVHSLKNFPGCATNEESGPLAKVIFVADFLSNEFATDDGMEKNIADLPVEVLKSINIDLDQWEGLKLELKEKTIELTKN